MIEHSRYQSQQTAPLLTNEQEGLVNKFASAACNGHAFDSGRHLQLAVTQRSGRSRTSSLEKFDRVANSSKKGKICERKK